MKSLLASALLLAICVTEAHSQDSRQEFPRPFGREPVKQRVPAPPPAQTALLTMTGVHDYPVPIEPAGGLPLLVPIQLERLDPAITHARVLCDAASPYLGIPPGGGVVYPVDPLSQVARGYSAEVEIVKGALADTLRVLFQALPGKDLTRAAVYRCYLQLKTAGQWATADEVWQTYPVDPSRPSYISTIGEFPRN